MPTKTINISETTFVASGQPNSSFSFYPLMYAGTDATFQNCISLLKITLPELPISAVDSAKLELAVISKSGTTPSPVVVNNVTSPFVTANVTYNTIPSFTATSAEFNVLQSDLYTRIQIDVTTLVNEWLSGTTENNGIALTNSDGSTVVEFATNAISYEPYYPSLVLTYSEAPAEASAICFSYAQLAHVIEQLIVLYPTNVITVFTKGFSASSITGTPYQLYKSSLGTYGALFILMDNGQQQAIPLNSITAIYTGDGTVYNPSITYLRAPVFPAGCDTNLVTSYYEYLPVSTYADIYSGAVIHATGTVYKNEYGIIVLTDGVGNTPVFIPVFNINAVLPALKAGAKTNAPKVTIEVTKQ